MMHRNQWVHNLWRGFIRTALLQPYAKKPLPITSINLYKNLYRLASWFTPHAF